MNCERYRKWVRAAALESPDGSRQAALHAHLAECAGCRESLQVERRLFAAIDRGLGASVMGQPSLDFLARVRLRLAAESAVTSARLPWFRSGWMTLPVAGLIALAMLAAITSLATRHRLRPEPLRQTARVGSPSAPAMAVAPTAGGAGPDVRLVASGAAHKQFPVAPRPQRARTDRSAGVGDGAPRFQVIAEPGQWREIVAAYQLAQSGHVDVTSLAQMSDGKQPEEIKPIQIKPVAIAELYPEKSTDHAGR